MNSINGIALRMTLASMILMVTAVSQSYAEGDVKKGEKVFKKCVACHTVSEGGKNKVGPNLWNIVGAKAAQKEGFKYSDALKNADIVWNEENLDKWLTKPKKFVKGTKMVFVGLKKEKDRVNIISYLQTLK